MGIVYCGPYADAIGYHDHEGYAARILPDGAETGTWTYATREFTGHRAHCDCGWRGTGVYPPTEHGEELADEEWNRDHLQPLINAEARKHTLTGDVLIAFVRELRGSVTCTANDQGEAVLTERSRGLLDAIERLEQLLNDRARR